MTGTHVTMTGTDPLTGATMLRSQGFDVAGLPAPQGSKRPVRLGNGRIGMAESSKAVGPWREAVRGEAQRIIAAPFTGPVFVTLLFRLPRPQAHYRRGRHAGQLLDSAPQYPGGTPDLDKLCRSTLDGLTSGGAWADDAQVVRLTAVKIYCAPGGAGPGCVITITQCAPAGADARLDARADARAIPLPDGFIVGADSNSSIFTGCTAQQTVTAAFGCTAQPQNGADDPCSLPF